MIYQNILEAIGHTPIVQLQRMRKVVFVSNSDNCRGPMAAEILRNQELQQEYVIASRGLVVHFPEPANQKAEAIMKSQQMTLENHMATQLTEEDLDEETLVLVFEEKQKWKIVSDYEYVKHVYTLSEFVEDDRQVQSAHGQPLVVYGENFELLKELIGKLADKLNEEAKEL